MINTFSPRRTVLLALVGLAALAPPAAKAATVPIDGPAWAQRAVDRMRVPVPADQTVILGPCPGWALLNACNFSTPDSPIFIDPPLLYDETGAMRVALYREMGGRFDTLAMTPAGRWHFMMIVHRVGPWWNTNAMLNDSGEVFEDAYADCALGVVPQRITLQRPESDRWIDEEGYHPSASRHARVCALIGRMGKRAGLTTPNRRAPAA